MKLKNTTAWSDRFLRRMVAWAAKQVELPPKVLRVAEFGKRAHGAYNGWACGRTIRVVIGPPTAYPVKPHNYPGRKSAAYAQPGYADPVEALVCVTVHELEHLRGYEARRAFWRRVKAGAVPIGRPRVHGEKDTARAERLAIEVFRANREMLLAEWSQEAERKAANTSETKGEQ